jgi:hypothetical protein
MDNYSKQIDINTIVINNVYKLITNKNVFLAKFVGRNKNEGLHFVLDANKHTIVLKVSEIQNIYEQ